MSAPTAESLFPELPAEQARLAASRAWRDRMIARFEQVDPQRAADEITQEYVEVTVAEALEDLRTPGAGDFFGRITEQGRAGATGPTWYVGRRHIEDDDHEPVVVDWRAPVAAPFYRATHVDPVGLAHRRRFTTSDGQLTAYLDEQLDDPDHETGGTGIPDPVLAEIGAARTGAMRDIVATIQAEQDEVIRAPLDQCLVVQGGPGTGKTAVGLHRAAYLLFEHRRRLSATGVLVVGPNPVFLDYIANVLPSLGERSVRQCTAIDLCLPSVAITATDDDEARAQKGSPDMLAAIESATTTHLRRPVDEVRVPLGARTLVFPAPQLNDWIDQALDARAPVNRRRASLAGIVQRDTTRRFDRDDVWQQAPALRAALARAWPTQQPIRLADALLPGRRGRRRAWTVADQFVVDEANSLLNGTPFTSGHVVVDEAQDLSAVALRCIGRRSPAGSLTVLGDLAQSTTPAGQRSWDDALAWLCPGPQATAVARLTVGYRVPGPILEVANRLLALTGVDVTPGTSVRGHGQRPAVRRSRAADLADTVADEVVAVRHRHHHTGVVSPAAHHSAITAALARRNLRTTGRVDHLDHDEVPLFDPESVKGLEFDGVVVVQAHEIADGSQRGARLLYVAMTRAVQVLHLVGDQPPPAVLGLSG